MKQGYMMSIGAAVTLAAVGLVACEPEAARPQTSRGQQAEKAREAANSVRFNENAEIENVKRRLQLTTDPGKLGFIVLLNDAGQPIVYEGVKGKVTSGGKRLTEPDRIATAGNGNGGTSMAVRAAPSDEGTWGSSNPYIFYWNINDVYRQWSGHYLYSDQPFRLSTEPLVVNIVPVPAQ